LVFLLANLLSSKTNSQTIDERLANLITQNANGYWEENWKVSLSQYQAWIGLISLREAGKGRSVAHSGRSGDQFYHLELGNKFPFCMGVGPFQLHKGGQDGGEYWDLWPIIDKVNPERSLLSVLRWHKNRWGTTSGDTLDLETFSTNSPWLAVNLNKTDDFKITWKNITGTSWDDTSKNTEEPVTISWPFAGDDSYETYVKYVGKVYWKLEFWDDYSNKLQKWDGYYDTWHITALNWDGKPFTQYYYTYREEGDTGWEILVYDDPDIDDSVENFIYGFKRCYKSPNKTTPLYYPEDIISIPSSGNAGVAGFTGSERILDPNPYNKFKLRPPTILGIY